MSSSKRFIPHPSPLVPSGASFVLLLAALMLAGCGFQLRGSATLPFSTLYVDAPGGSLFATQLRRVIGSGSETRITNNQAEYMTLIRALHWLADQLDDDAAEVSVAVWGDSQLVINQLQGMWKVRNEGLKPLVREAQEQLSRFGRTRLTWHPRAFSVARLGH